MAAADKCKAAFSQKSREPIAEHTTCPTRSQKRLGRPYWSESTTSAAFHSLERARASQRFHSARQSRPTGRGNTTTRATIRKILLKLRNSWPFDSPRLRQKRKFLSN